jgi:hypothetical protein
MAQCDPSPDCKRLRGFLRPAQSALCIKTLTERYSTRYGTQLDFRIYLAAIAPFQGVHSADMRQDTWDILRARTTDTFRCNDFHRCRHFANPLWRASYTGRHRLFEQLLKCPIVHRSALDRGASSARDIIAVEPTAATDLIPSIVDVNNGFPCVKT